MGMILAKLDAKLAKIDAKLDSVTNDIASMKADIASTKTDIASMKTDISSTKTDIASMKTDISSIKNALLVPEGDAESNRFAVAIKWVQDGAETGGIEGHGAVVAMKNNCSPGGDGDGVADTDNYEVYLLSAAHVLISIARREIIIEQNNTNVEQNNTSVQSQSFRCYAGELYISKEYMATGLKDFGFVKLLHKDRQSRIQIRNIEKLDVTKFADVAQVGKSVVAHGQVYLRGTVTSKVDESGRCSVHGHSKPGQSGSLVFYNDKSVAGVVHGSSKHRGKHAAAAHEDAAIVYCDIVGFCDLICVKDEDKLVLLQYAECIPEKVASGLVTFSAFIRASTSTCSGEAAEWNLTQKCDLDNATELKLHKVMEAMRKLVGIIHESASNEENEARTMIEFIQKLDLHQHSDENNEKKDLHQLSDENHEKKVALEKPFAPGLELQVVMDKLLEKISLNDQHPVSFSDAKLVVLTSFLPVVT